MTEDDNKTLAQPYPTSRFISQKEYAAEELADMGNDMDEVFLDNAEFDEIPTDESGFKKGSFVVTVVWRSPEWCSCTGFRHIYGCPYESKEICF